MALALQSQQDKIKKKKMKKGWYMPSQINGTTPSHTMHLDNIFIDLREMEEMDEV